MYSEQDLLPVSAIQHFIFCQRRAALVFTEGVWLDNEFTAEGELLHARAHETGEETRAGVLVARNLRLHCLELGLVGVTDIVEFRTGRAGNLTPYPIEYKRGQRRHEKAYEAQLCAQAFCLEEMLGVCVTRGALYYAATRRRLEIEFNEGLRQVTREASYGMRALLVSGRTPPPKPGPRCRRCSLEEACLPRVVRPGHSASNYVRRLVFQTEREEDD